MSIEHTRPGAALDTLRAALTQLRALATVPSADPFYAQTAEQVAAIVAGLETRAAAKGEPAPNQQEPPNPDLLPDAPSQGGASASGGLDPVPPNPG